MTIFVAAIVLLLLSGLLAPFSRFGAVFPDRLSLALGVSGSICGVAATTLCLLRPEAMTLTLAWPAINGSFALRIDGLSVVFLLPAFVITGAGLLYGSGYRPHAKDPVGSAWIRTFFPVLAAAIGLVLTAANGVVFLCSWEIMALAGYFLVITERQKKENFQAGYIYLITTHTGTLALFGLFALLGESACLHLLPAVGSVASGSAMIFFLTLIGFGCKAGIMPLHIWLPGAHAAAPSHVSALMSGVMIKTGIYGILRIMSLFQTIPAWWGWMVLALGIVSGILGVVFAIAQHDIKRLLAYHSIENIGIILLGCGAAMLGKSNNQPAVALLGLAGALLHVVNHGLFKGLLFLSAGSMINAVGSRRLDRYGGLLSNMPVTGFFFLGGAVAICGLPPLNGFVSEWLVYLGLLRAGFSPTSGMSGALVAVPGLALTGGLALLCFAKVFGLSFLGTARADRVAVPREAGPAMLIAMGILFCCCLWIGMLPKTVLPLLTGGLALWTGSTPMAAGETFQALAPAASLTFAALFLFALLLMTHLLTRRQKNAKKTDDANLASPPGGRSLPTWGCGFNQPLPRAQYTTSSFAAMITALFRWALNTGFNQTTTDRLFPMSARFKSHTPDAVLDLFLVPVCHRLAGFATLVRRIVHQGIIGVYLLYSALVLCLFLGIVIYWF